MNHYIEKAIDLLKTKTDYYYKHGNPHLFEKYKGNKKIFFMLVPTYNNMGDQAIEYSTECFLRQILPEYSLIKINLEDTYSHLKAVEAAYEDGDIIALQGGGNMGNLYPMVEYARREVLDKLSSCRIISFPTTFTFTNDKKGLFELEKSKKIYSAASNYVMFSRESYSFADMKKSLPRCEVYNVPDMVFMLHKYINVIPRERKGVLVCLRRDKESILKDQLTNLIKSIDQKYQDVFIFDTLVFRNVFDDLRYEELKSILNEFSKYKVVITDRIHGMIFSAITGTPCVAMKSYDSKVNGSYKWIEGLPYVKLVTDVKIAQLSLHEFYYDDNNYEYNSFYNKMIEEKYKPLMAALIQEND